jgi:hypothetical protein
MINKKEAKQLVQWGIKNNFVTKGVPSRFAVSTIKRRFYDSRQDEKAEMTRQVYDDVIRQIKAERG